ncbi:glycine zipper 2TM domain-containing protein [Pseudomonas sp. OTU5201]|uniref:glycine zipper 2TM domain-containing protein n=1 Tax=Pseudomonas sp. OTU5201 TaxID=3043850 RepID=UPI00313AB7F0
MTTMNRFGPVLGMVCLLALAACSGLGAFNGSPDSGSTTQGGPGYSGYGVVQSINPVGQDYQGVAGTGYGLGTIMGALVGGVAGNQVGSGTGKTVATVAGTAGGAYIGHQIETRNQKTTGYAISVRMENGSNQTLTQSTNGGLSVGDRVRIDNGNIRRY